MTIEGVKLHPVPPSIEANCAFVLLKPYLKIGDHANVVFDPAWINSDAKFSGVWMAGDFHVFGNIVGNVVMCLS